MSDIGAAGGNYEVLVGTGGVGTGMFFDLCGSETLGRSESRAGRLVERRDYCKLHIICHYVKTLLHSTFPVIPIGRLGDDSAGRSLWTQMERTGLDMRHMGMLTSVPTLFSVCFTYPDGDGCNVTTTASASSTLSVDNIRHAVPVFERYSGRGIALAAPEVPLEARSEILALATRHGFLRIASFTSSELGEVRETNMLQNVDIVALNLEEATALCQLDSTATAETIIDRTVELVAVSAPELRVVITAGPSGSWVVARGSAVHTPVIAVDVLGTAGAGDAHLAGLIVGLVGGQDLPTANQFASVVSGLAVTSVHTIHPDLNAEMVRANAEKLDRSLAEVVRQVLGPGQNASFDEMDALGEGPEK